MITVAGVNYPEMADSVQAANLRGLAWADALLGYVNGNWADYQQIAAENPAKPVYGLTVFADTKDGDGTDSETGNASIAQTVANTKGELARGVARPIVYCPASWAAGMVQAHTAAGVDRNLYRLVTAHYGWPHTIAGFPPGCHFCGTGTCGYGPGANGTQWFNSPSYDRSILDPEFLGPASHPGPAPTPAPVNQPTCIQGENMEQFIASVPIGADGKGEAIFDGGANTLKGIASLSPAIPYPKFTAATAYGPCVGVGDTDYDGRVEQQNRNGFLYLAAHGFPPAPAGQAVMRDVATVAYAD